MQPEQDKPCALCLERGKLCRSHIIPEFFFGPCYEGDEPRKLFQLSVDPKEETTIRQQGIWEYLLCEECEGRLSLLEDYAKRVIFGDMKIAFREFPEKREFVGIDYMKFKIFQMSLLWRAGVSTRREFANVELGPHEERLRGMIHRGEPGEPYEYGCIMAVSPRLKDEKVYILVAPRKWRWKSHHLYHFLLGYTGFLFLVSKHTNQLGNMGLFLSRDGTLPVFFDTGHMPNLLGQFSLELRKAGKLEHPDKVQGIR